MNHESKRVALVGVSPDVAQRDWPHRFPSFGIRRVHAALVADPTIEILLIDEKPAPAEDLASRVIEFQPDVLGLSMYVWSFELLCELARLVKAALPNCLVTAGGPSARTQMFDLEPFFHYREVIDALVLSEGEEAIREIAATSGDRDELKTIAGLAIPASSGWFHSAEREPNPDMDLIESPFQKGLMPSGHVAYLETFRGCPLSCAFCQWGVMDSKRRFSKDYLVRELSALKSNKPVYTFLVDAALNLNAAAFRDLSAAEEEIGFFQSTPLLCEVYPSLLRAEHLAFLERCRNVHVGLGVQSLEPRTLNAVSRPFKPHHLRAVIEQLSAFCLVDLEIILGLPGDTAESFRQTLEQVLTLPCNVRVYKCLVLPDALLSRAPKEFEIKFDPRTLMMTACHSWPENELRETQDYVRGLAELRGFADEGDYFWHFTATLPKYRLAYAGYERPRPAPAIQP